MAGTEDNLQKLFKIGAEIKSLEKRKIVLESNLENLTKELNFLKDNTNKEIALQKQQCNDECQTLKNEANKILKEAEDKLRTAEARKEDSEAINELIAKLNEKIMEHRELQKEADKALSSAAEREYKANLLIEQYKKRLEELGETKKEKKIEIPKSKTQKEKK